MGYSGGSLTLDNTTVLGTVITAPGDSGKVRVINSSANVNIREEEQKGQG